MPTDFYGRETVEVPTAGGITRVVAVSDSPSRPEMRAESTPQQAQAYAQQKYGAPTPTREIVANSGQTRNVNLETQGAYKYRDTGDASKLGPATLMRLSAEQQRVLEDPTAQVVVKDNQLFVQTTQKKMIISEQQVAQVAPFTKLQPDLRAVDISTGIAPPKIGGTPIKYDVELLRGVAPHRFFSVWDRKTGEGGEAFISAGSTAQPSIFQKADQAINEAARSFVAKFPIGFPKGTEEYAAGGIAGAAKVGIVGAGLLGTAAVSPALATGAGLALGGLTVATVLGPAATTGFSSLTSGKGFAGSVNAIVSRVKTDVTALTPFQRGEAGGMLVTAGFLAAPDFAKAPEVAEIKGITGTTEVTLGGKTFDVGFSRQGAFDAKGNLLGEVLAAPITMGNKVEIAFTESAGESRAAGLAKGYSIMGESGESYTLLRTAKTTQVDTLAKGYSETLSDFAKSTRIAVMGSDETSKSFSAFQGIETAPGKMSIKGFSVDAIGKSIDLSTARKFAGTTTTDQPVDVPLPLFQREWLPFVGKRITSVFNEVQRFPSLITEKASMFGQRGGGANTPWPKAELPKPEANIQAFGSNFLAPYRTPETPKLPILAQEMVQKSPSTMQLGVPSSGFVEAFAKTRLMEITKPSVMAGPARLPSLTGVLASFSTIGLSKFAQSVRQQPAVLQLNRPIQGQAIKPIQFQIPKPIQTQRIDQIVTTKQITGITETPIQFKLTPLTTITTFKVPWESPPPPPPIIIPGGGTGGFGNLMIPGGAGGIPSFTPFQIGRRKMGYTPNLAGILSGKTIKKVPREPLTGLEVRFPVKGRSFL